MKDIYVDISGGKIETKILKVDNVSCLVHRSNFLKHMYNLLNNSHLMIDADWNPLSINRDNLPSSKKVKIYSEVASGDWFHRTHKKMMIRHMKCHNSSQPILIAIILGQDGSVCDKIGRASAEPILGSIGNIKYNKRKNHNAWFCFGNVPSYPKAQLEAKKDSNRVATKELKNEFYHDAITFILEDLINIQKFNGIEMIVNINGNVRKTTCYFEVAYIIGDSLGNNKISGHYVNFSGNVKRKQRECNIDHVHVIM